MAKVCWAAKEAWPRPAPSCSAAPTRVLSPCVGDDEVGLAVAVEVRHRHGDGARAGGEGLLGGEGRRGGARRRRVQQHATPCCRPWLATTRSGLPSPLRSPPPRSRGLAPVAKVCWAAKEGVAAPGAVVFSSTDTVLSIAVGDDEVGLAVAVEVRHRHGVGLGPDGEGLLGGEGGVAAPAPSCSAAPTPCCRAAVGDDEVGLAVAVEVGHRHGVGVAAGGEGPAGRRRRAWSPPAPSCSAAPTRCWSRRWRRRGRACRRR